MIGKTPGSPVILLIALLMVSLASIATEPGRPQPQLKIEELGAGQYRVGSIDIDKKQQRFSVTGKVTGLEPGSPLEYLAVTSNGYKKYESLFELNATAREFNLACILVGLDAGLAKVSRYHFDPQQVEGDPVRLSVSWELAGKIITRSPGELFALQGVDRIQDSWVYTGSVLSSNGAYLAEDGGTLIGFIHDPASIIEHRTGLGIGDYGAAEYDPARLPPPGSVITLVVKKSATRPVPDSPPQ